MAVVTQPSSDGLSITTPIVKDDILGEVERLTNGSPHCLATKSARPCGHGLSYYEDFSVESSEQSLPLLV